MNDSEVDNDSCEEDFAFIGGPYDGWTLTLPRDQMKYALPAEAASLFSELEDMAGDIARLANSLDTLRTEQEFLEALDGDPDEEDYAEPAPGGVLYRPEDGGRTFRFVGRISVAEFEARQPKD